MQQQQNMGGQPQQQQQIYPQPPKMVTTKDALYLSDMMSWNLLAMKKAHFFAQQCQDPEVRQMIEKAGQMHQRHYDRILNQLENSQQPMQNMQQQPPLQ